MCEDDGLDVRHGGRQGCRLGQVAHDNADIGGEVPRSRPIADQRADGMPTSQGFGNDQAADASRGAHHEHPELRPVHAATSSFSDAMSITKRYFTSDFSMRS